jgi:hypothetical protein
MTCSLQAGRSVRPPQKQHQERQYADDNKPDKKYAQSPLGKPVMPVVVRLGIHAGIILKKPEWCKRFYLKSAASSGAIARAGR